MPVFIITGITISGFFIVFILSKKNRKKTDFLLALINLLWIGLLLLDVLTRQHMTATRLFLQALLPFYSFPLFLLFAAEMLQFKMRTPWLPFIPAFITTLYTGVDLYLIVEVFG